MDAEALLRELSTERSYPRTTTGYWAHLSGLDVRAMARLMSGNGVRLVTLTAVPLDDATLRVIYHWDADGELVNVSTTVKSAGIATIGDIVPAADWAEREIHDYYGLEFDGRTSTPPLMLREGDPPGLFSRTRDQGIEVDPARTAAEEGRSR